MMNIFSKAIFIGFLFFFPGSVSGKSNVDYGDYNSVKRHILNLEFQFYSKPHLELAKLQDEYLKTQKKVSGDSKTLLTHRIEALNWLMKNKKRKTRFFTEQMESMGGIQEARLLNGDLSKESKLKLIALYADKMFQKSKEEEWLFVSGAAFYHSSYSGRKELEDYLSRADEESRNYKYAQHLLRSLDKIDQK